MDKITNVNINKLFENIQKDTRKLTEDKMAEDYYSEGDQVFYQGRKGKVVETYGKEVEVLFADTGEIEILTLDELLKSNESKINEKNKKDIPEDILDIMWGGLGDGHTFKEIVNNILDWPQGKEWFEEEYSGNEFDLRQELESIYEEERSKGTNESKIKEEKAPATIGGKWNPEHIYLSRDDAKQGGIVHLAHKPENVILVWWYNPSTGEFVKSKEKTALHMDNYNKEVNPKEQDKWVKGRVFKSDDKTYVVIYDLKNIEEKARWDLLDKLNSFSKPEIISTIIDSDGKDISNLFEGTCYKLTPSKLGAWTVKEGKMVESKEEEKEIPQTEKPKEETPVTAPEQGAVLDDKTKLRGGDALKEEESEEIKTAITPTESLSEEQKKQDNEPIKQEKVVESINKSDLFDIKTLLENSLIKFDIKNGKEIVDDFLFTLKKVGLSESNLNEEEVKKGLNMEEYAERDISSGSRVEIIDPGLVYPNDSKSAESLGLKGFEKGFKPGKGEKGIVDDLVKNTIGDKIFIVKLDSGKEVMVGLIGVKKLKESKVNEMFKDLPPKERIQHIVSVGGEPVGYLNKNGPYKEITDSEEIKKYLSSGDGYLEVAFYYLPDKVVIGGTLEDVAGQVVQLPDKSIFTVPKLNESKKESTDFYSFFGRVQGLLAAWSMIETFKDPLGYIKDQLEKEVKKLNESRMKKLKEKYFGKEPKESEEVEMKKEVNKKEEDRINKKTVKELGGKVKENIKELKNKYIK